MQQLLREAEAAYRAGDFQGSARAFYRIFSAEPDAFAVQAARYAASVHADDRQQFWQKPDGFYPPGADLAAIFAFIYERGVWGGGSGAGSDLAYVVPYVGYLQALMDRNAIHSVLDLGCGDWRFSRYLNFGARAYLGLDIVPSVIEANKVAFGAPSIRFARADISAAEPWPAVESGADAPPDLIVSKDVLQHLSNANVLRILDKCRDTKFVLITNDYHPANSDCADGETRPLDVTAPPFNFPARPVLAFGGKVSFLGGTAVTAPL